MVTTSDSTTLIPETDDNQSFLHAVTTEEFIPPTSRWISLTGFVLTGTIAIAVTMATMIKYNVTVKATATVRPLGKIPLVQSENEGTVKDILVKENQNIKKGQVIAQLDNTQQLIKKSQLQANIQQSNLQLVQIDAQVQSLNTQIAAESQSNTRAIAAAEAELARNQREYQDRKITTQTELLAAEAQLQKEQADLQKAEADSEFAISEKNRYQILATKGAISQNEFDKKLLAVKQNQSSVAVVQKSVNIAIARIKSAEATINPSNATVDIASERIAQEKAKGEALIATLTKEKQALNQRRVEMLNQIRQAQKELQQVDTQLEKNLIRATSDGIILKLDLRNPGQVLRAGEPIAQIIPQNADAVIKAMVPTNDVKKVMVGQDVQLRFEACSYPDYGTLKGVVTTVSPDAISPQNNTGEVTSQSENSNGSYFEATIKPKNLSFGKNNKHCRIQAGMKATADIISKQETALEFLLRKARLITDL